VILDSFWLQLLRVALIVLGAPVLLLLLLSGARWVMESDDAQSARATAPRHLEDLMYHATVSDALEAFSSLPEAERRALLGELEASLVGTDEWLDSLPAADYSLLCIGEDHEESTRRFLAERLFPRLDIEALYLEATPAELEDIAERIASGEPRVPLLDADIGAVIRAARRRNPAVLVYGIEETREQESAREREDRKAFRDQSIATNFFRSYTPRARALILYGAHHCQGGPNWLYTRIRSAAPAEVVARMHNIRVIGGHQNDHLEAFLFFLGRLGLGGKEFVIPATDRLPPEIHRWFWALRQVWGPYRTLVVFR
jgi:hypothetical protein